MVPRGLTIERSTWVQPEPEQQRFYDSPPPRMDVSVCCLPASAGSGAQHSHPASLPSGGQSTIQAPYQYADQIVPDRGQPDGLAVLGCTGQNNWQQISNSSTVAAGVTATTTAYIDYSWLQMQVSGTNQILFIFFLFFFRCKAWSLIFFSRTMLMSDPFRRYLC